VDTPACPSPWQVDKDNQVTIRTTYPRLDLMLQASSEPSGGSADDEEESRPGHQEPGRHAEATVSIKRLSRVLAAVGAPPRPSLRAAPAARSHRTLTKRDSPFVCRVVHCRAVSGDCKIQQGVLCVVPGQIVLLKLFLQDVQHTSVMLFYLPVML